MVATHHYDSEYVPSRDEVVWLDFEPQVRIEFPLFGSAVKRINRHTPDQPNQHPSTADDELSEDQP